MTVVTGGAAGIIAPERGCVSIGSGGGTRFVAGAGAGVGAVAAGGLSAPPQPATVKPTASRASTVTDRFSDLMQVTHQ